MKAIDLTRYGFTRARNGDWSNGYCNGIVYRAGKNLTVTVIESHRKPTRIEVTVNRTMPLWKYTSEAFPHSKAVNKYRYCAEKASHEDLEQFYRDCLEFDKECFAPECSKSQASTTPTLEECRDRCREISQRRSKAFYDFCAILNDHLFELVTQADRNQWSALYVLVNEVHKQVDEYKPCNYPETHLRTPAQREFFMQMEVLLKRTKEEVALDALIYNILDQK